MDGLTIHIDWVYFLGILGALIGIAWYSNGRFTALETSMTWVVKTLDKLDNFGKEIIKDEVAPAGSPRRLNDRGIKILNESGVKSFVDKKKDELLAKVRERAFSNPYDAEQCILAIMQDVPNLYPEVVSDLKTGAFQTGTDISTVLLVGGFYLRDLIFPELGFSVDDIADPKVS